MVLLKNIQNITSGDRKNIAGAYRGRFVVGQGSNSKELLIFSTLNDAESFICEVRFNITEGLYGDVLDPWFNAIYSCNSLEKLAEFEGVIDKDEFLKQLTTFDLSCGRSLTTNKFIWNL